PMHRMAHFPLLPALALAVTCALVPFTVADPQATQLNLGCSQYNATPTAAFLAALNSTFAELRANLSAGSGFATAAEPRAAAPAFALAQCRPYVTGRDCVACFDAAAARIHAACGAANGGRAILDGCVIRYESVAFFDQSTLPGNTQRCNGSAVAGGAFDGAVQALVRDLTAAVPRVPRLAAAAAGAGVYAMAQCVETVAPDGCAQCLEVAASNIDRCPPNSDGRAVDAGCFMRYSDKPFFPANATADLTPYLRSGKSRGKGAIVGAILGGLAFLLLLGLLALLLTWRSMKLKKPRRGDILGATELQGPTSFNYHDLKAATNNFSEKSKIGEGGFGDVFKGLLKNGKIVAVKRLAVMQTSRAKEDFESEVRDVEHLTGSSDSISLLAWLVALHIFIKSSMCVSYTATSNLAMCFLMMTSNLRLLILVWQGSYLMIIVISALDLQEHWVTLLPSMQSTASYRRRLTHTALV
uniref:Gnk2-homologous domain-containing protein n=1 Tax=Aegilops tauschii subsp. strangulata TaxID=200361 RepID=A0A453DRT9_AEGTS